MGFNDWIYAQPTKLGSVSKPEEVEEEAKKRIAQKIQTKIRGTLDTGTLGSNARRAQAVRVQAEGNRLVIEEKDNGDILAGRQGKEKPKPPIKSLEQLFQPSSGVPELVTNPDGTTQLAFRTVSANEILGAVSQKDIDGQIKSLVRSTLDNDLMTSFEEAVSEINKRYPEDKL